MGLHLYNTLSRTVEEFVPLDPPRVRMYCCGPTVHDSAHIGNFRTFIFSDVLRRYLEFLGYQVEHVMNITDVEDKIIARVRESGRSLVDYTRERENAFWDDLKKLGCLRPHRSPRATEHIPEMIDLIGKLMERGFAYVASDGSVYFSIEKYRAAGNSYGQLVRLNFESMRTGERIRNDEYGKESVADFALWKARAPEDGEVFWPSPWGEGRPGWHIECSAMSMKYLGPSFDIHLGGEDLIFPHHEDEIAQSEGAGLQPPGRRFVKYWLHGAHLLVEGKKMSKSLGNYFTLGDLLAKGFTGQEIRYLILTAHYRESFNFTLEGLRGAQVALGRLGEWYGRLLEVANGERGEADAEILGAFRGALDNDLNLSAAWGAIFTWVRELNRRVDQHDLTRSQAASVLATWESLERVLGLKLKPPVTISSTALAGASEAAEAQAAPIPPEILSLLEKRQAARAAKNFKEADRLRDELKAAGWVIEDTPKGPRLKKA